MLIPRRVLLADDDEVLRRIHTISRRLHNPPVICEQGTEAELKTRMAQDPKRSPLVLMDQLGLVTDKRSASKIGLTNRVDAGEFFENETQLARDLLGLGMMREYSDATRMVHGEVG